MENHYLMNVLVELRREWKLLVAETMPSFDVLNVLSYWHAGRGGTRSHDVQREFWLIAENNVVLLSNASASSRSKQDK